MTRFVLHCLIFVLLVLLLYAAAKDLERRGCDNSSIWCHYTKIQR